MHPDTVTHHGVGTPEPTLRSLLWCVYLPTFVFACGQGAVIPIVALTALDLGASVAVAGAAVAVKGIGTMVFDVPAGNFVARFGERKAMLMATVLLVGALIGCVLSPNPAVFLVCMFFMGCGWSVWLLARLTYITDVMPPNMRGRALSTLGGTQRIGNFIGPLVGAVAVTMYGLDGAYYFHIILAIVGCVVLFSVREPTEATPPTGHPPIRVRAIARDHGYALATAGVAAIAISVLRAARQVILPLWAASIGFDAATVSIVFGISAAMDMVLFYPAGIASDRWGRKIVAVPCTAMMALGMLLMPLTSDLGALIAVGVLLGFGNGLGAGIIMTLGSDLAPNLGRAEFLGVWRLIGDMGTAGGPLLISGLGAVATLGTASVAIGAFGMAGALFVLVGMPESHPVSVRAANRARSATRTRGEKAADSVETPQPSSLPADAERRNREKTGDARAVHTPSVPSTDNHDADTRSRR